MLPAEIDLEVWREGVTNLSGEGPVTLPIISSREGRSLPSSHSCSEEGGAVTLGEMTFFNTGLSHPKNSWGAEVAQGQGRSWFSVPVFLSLTVQPSL